MGNDFPSKVGDQHMLIPRVCMHKKKLTLVGLLDAALSIFNHYLGAKKNSCFFANKSKNSPCSPFRFHFLLEVDRFVGFSVFFLFAKIFFLGSRRHFMDEW